MSPRLSSLVPRLLYWIPAISWAGLIFILSATPSLSLGQGVADLILRKVAHVLVYMVLAILIYAALQQSWRLTWRKQVALRAVLISMLYAVFDEIHQTTVPTRNGNLIDIFINALGVGLGLAVVAWFEWWRQLTANPWTADNLTGGTKLVSLLQLPAFAQAFAQQLQPGSVIALHGDLGAGKTTLTTHLAKALGVTKKISSPTYTIAKQYKMANNQTLYHYDWYRLQDAQQVSQLAIDEVIDQVDGIIIIEWPERALHLLPAHTIHLELKYVDQHTRKITINR